MRDKVCIFLQKKCACLCRASFVFCFENLANRVLIFLSLKLSGRKSGCEGMVSL